jgi:hypothetical protein
MMRFSSIHTLLLAAATMSSLLFAGCDSRPKRVPVAGTVYIDGQPVKGGHIRVIPNSARSAQAMIDKDGKFRLGTFETTDGAVLGEHPIEVVSVESLGPNSKRWLIPKKYSSVTTSNKTIVIDKPIEDMRIELTWDGEKPFVETIDNSGDAPPVGAVPADGNAPAPTATP